MSVFHVSVYLQADKRHLTEKYSAQIEILLVVDNSIFRKYLRANSYSVTAAKDKIKEYFSILFAMVSIKLIYFNNSKKKNQPFLSYWY